jgi:hypothetical protein
MPKKERQLLLPAIFFILIQLDGAKNENVELCSKIVDYEFVSSTIDLNSDFNGLLSNAFILMCLYLLYNYS